MYKRQYFWRVRANDSNGYSSWSEKWNFTILSVSIITVNGTANFGGMVLGEVDDTIDNNPCPLTVENNGNVVVNVSVYAQDSLWVMQPLNTSYFQFRAGNYTAENNSFLWEKSVTSWTDMPGISSEQAVMTFAYLNFSDSNDMAELDIRVQVPTDESAGPKSSTVVFEAKQS